MDPIRFSPSDFAFLWEQCRRCFWLKTVRGIKQPSMPMAAIFKKLEALQMTLYEGRRTTDVLPDLPPGVIRCGERWVESEPAAPPGAERSCFVAGKIDSLIEFDDGSWGVIDFKTTEIKPEKAVLYGRQLHAYAHAFENPAKTPRAIRNGEAPHLSPITKLGILCLEPARIELESPGRQVFRCEVKWFEIPRDDGKFRAFMGDLVRVVAGPIPPPAPTCDWCGYAENVKTGGFGGAGESPASSRPPAAGGPAQPAPAAPAAADAPQCPQCEAPMREREGKFGRFWGCSRYPACKGTRRA